MSETPLVVNLRRDLSDALRTIDTMVREKGEAIDLISRMVERDLVSESGDPFRAGVQQGWNTALAAAQSVLTGEHRDGERHPSLVDLVDLVGPELRGGS